MEPLRIERYPAWYLRLVDRPVRPANFYDALVPIAPPKPTSRLEIFGLKRRARDSAASSRLQAAKHRGLETSGPGSQPFELAGNERLAVWVDVSVPRDARPGEYAAPITVRFGRGVLRAKLALKVYDFVLPEARAVTCLGGFSHETIFRQLARRDGPAGAGRSFVPIRLDPDNKQVRAGLIVIRRLMRLAHAHRLDLFDKTIHPILKRSATGSSGQAPSAGGKQTARFGQVRLLWKDYDSIVKPYLDGTAFEDRIGVAAWPAPIRADWPDPANYGGSDTDAYREAVTAVASQVVKHFQTLGMAEKLFFWPRTDPKGPGGYDRYAAHARLIRSAAGGAMILAELPPKPPPPTNEAPNRGAPRELGDLESSWKPPKHFASIADMYAPPGHMFDPSEAPSLLRIGKPLAGAWIRPGQPPYVGSCGVLDAPADVRAIPWLAMKYRCAGIFLPEVLEGSQARLFYPGGGAGEVLPSVRLKRLRRGLQDAAYLWLLRQRNRGAIAEVMIDTMVHYAGLDAAGDNYLDGRLDGWVRDGAVWVAARRLLAEEVLAAVHPEDVVDRQLLAQRLEWKRLQRRASRVRVERIRSRVQLLPDGRFRAAVRVDLFNELTRPVEVELLIASLPTGWRAVRRRVHMPAMPGGKRVVAELIAEGPGFLPAGDGKTPFPLSLKTELSERRDLLVRVPFVLAGKPGEATNRERRGLGASRELTIDADLSDWPVRSGNTAADFVLLGRRGRLGRGLAERQTAVFVLRDDRNLYLAFRCDEPDPAGLRARTDNLIRYEQLLAGEEDLVEVLFDPGRSAKAPEDLYHLVVKCNGVVVAERGVSSDPPLGRVRPWPVKPRVAVARKENIWIVEMAIPLDAFGPAGAARLWGINFTRFATAGWEASSWAGAVRYFYHPDNLGTLYLGPE